ncbi:hypothetical protein HPB47_000046 [Ixodes persulcatus]|uniref:Uncharacterized protein n=1 Tax=Ixodes persulcatus TaxID=34615 RepID=A0AC60PTD9_IXOPE|nr:hypothetical protein HPB47_000046 [Ixodes persulcatus]
MQYEVEGTSITPEDLQEGVWESVFRRQMNAHAAFVSKRQKEKATQEAARTAQQAATPSSTTPPGKREMDPAKPLKGSAQKRRPTLSRLPMEDIKVVFRPRGFDPVTYGASTLMMAILQLLPPLQSRPQEKIRIHPTNRTFTVSTPAQDRARRLGAATSLTLGDRTFQVSAYVAMPENSTRIVVPEALCMGETTEEVIHYATLDNPELNVLHARRMGKTRTMLMTIEGTKLPRQVTFRHAVLLCYPYREKIETCFNCRQTGHRADVCRQATSNKCRSCGTEHSNTNPDGSTYSCKPVCIICGGEHETGTQVCPHRFVQRKKTPTLSPPSDRKFRRRSRSRRRGAEPLRSRNRSRSSTSHPGSKGRTNQQQQRQDDPRKVSWASRVAHNTNTQPNNTMPPAVARELEALRKECAILRRKVTATPTSPLVNMETTTAKETYTTLVSQAHTPAATTLTPPTPTNAETETARPTLTAQRGQTPTTTMMTPLPQSSKRKATDAVSEKSDSSLTGMSTVESVTNSVKEYPKRRLRLRDRVARRGERIDRLEERMDSLEQKVVAMQQSLDSILPIIALIAAKLDISINNGQHTQTNYCVAMELQGTPPKAE